VQIAALFRRNTLERWKKKAKLMVNAASKNKKVLIIDDDVDYVEYLQTVIESAGYSVETAHSADQALEHIKAATPDLIILDIIMPEKDGEWFLDEFRKQYPELAGVPICFLTAKTGKLDILRGIQREVDAYLTKPVDQDILLTTIDARLKHRNRIKNAPTVGKTSLGMIILTALIGVSVFILDLVSPLGVAGGVPYVFLVFFSWWFRERAAPLYLALVASALTYLGFIYSPLGTAEWIVATNRFYAITAIWLLALVIWIASKRQSNHQYHEIEINGFNFNRTIRTEREWVFVAVLSVVILASTWGVIQHIDENTKSDVAKSLQTALKTSQVSIRSQLEEQKKSAKVWAKDKQIIAAVGELIGLPTHAATLINSQAQKNLRTWLTPVFRTTGYRGFFIIGKNNLSLASTRDNNIGVTNLLSQQEGFLDKIWAGQTEISIPQISDVPLIGKSGDLIHDSSTMFVATPIKFADEKVKAILVFRIDPHDVFAPTFEHGRLGESGETYAFSKDGLMISESRFNDHLIKIGLLSSNHSDLKIMVRDPGINMVLGGKPRLPRNKQPLTRMAQNATVKQDGLDLTGYADYRGVPVVGAWLWDEQLNFGIATEIDVDEAYATFKNTRFAISIFSILIVSTLMLFTEVMRRSRQRIAISEKKYRSTISSTSEGFWRSDLHGRLLEVNQAFCKMLGLNSEDLVGHLPMEFTNDESRINLEQNSVKIRTSDHRQANVVFLNSQGEMVHVNINATTTRDHQGEATGAFAFITNISKQKESEIKLQESMEEAETANRAKSEFLSSMSHELRTPLNAILGFGQLLEHDPIDPLTENQVGHIQQILKGGDTLLDLIDQVLELSKIEAGKVSLSIENVPLQASVDECFAMINVQAQDRNIDVIFTSPDFELPLLKTDHNRLNQVLLNLLTNAIKYNHEEGTVTVSTNITDNNFLRISVTDTGFGIAPEKQLLLFEPFNRLGREAGEIQGSGIGLTITKQIVELMGGTIGFESTENVGSTFWFELPISDDQSVECAIPLEEQISDTTIERVVSACIVLYIEDNSANINLMEAIIEQLPNISLKTAHTAELGLDVAREIKPNIILMDINLPGMDGIKALEKLRANEQTKSIPVVAISAAAMPKQIARGISYRRYSSPCSKTLKVGVNAVRT
jgi:PAS domain S-box-containing protein